MKAKARFICALLVVDTFFGAFYIGFNSRSVSVINPKLPPLVPKAEAKTKPAETKPPSVPAKTVSHPATSTVKHKPAKSASGKPPKGK